MTDPEAIKSAIEHARWYAALSGPFDPADALKASVRQDSLSSDLTLAVASKLSLVCDTHADGNGSQWLMRGTERQWDIEKLQQSSQLGEALDWRSGQTPFDARAQDLVDALRGTGRFSPSALETALKSSDPTEADREELERLASTLEWAGAGAPAYAFLDRARATINRVDDRRRSDTLLAQGFHGRGDQLQVVRDWLAAPITNPPVRALFVTGLPGIGKSALLEQSVRERIANQQNTIVVRLDFDRPTLDVLDQVGLTLEVARQVAAQLPNEAAAVRQLRLEAVAGSSESLKGRGRETLPANLAVAIGNLVKSSSNMVTVVLDTCEVLRGRGETHPRRLFEWLDNLVICGLAPMAVIAGGRGDAFDSVADRIGDRSDLTELTPEAAERLLDQAEVPATRRAEVHSIARGHPLLLRLAGAAARAAPAARRRRRSQSSDVAAAQLYRFLLSRIPDPDLRRLVNPGLLVRRINFELIRDVLAPELRVRRIGEARAKRLIEELEQQSWLLERDPIGPGWLRQRSMMRAQLLPLFYGTSPARCAKIDGAAAAWFARRNEAPLAIEAAYHRLQLMRRGDSPPAVDRDVALQFDAASLAELPEGAQDVVLHARGQRSTIGRSVAFEQPPPAGPPDPRAIKDLQYANERGDWLEAADLYSRAFANAVINPAGEEGDPLRTLLWRIGRWQQAAELLKKFDQITPHLENVEALSPEDAFARLEMRAEFDFTKLCVRLAEDPKWRLTVQRVVERGTKTEMRAGALGFAMQAAGITLRASWLHVDVVAAAFEMWGGSRSDAALGPALSAARDRFGRYLPAPVQEHSAASADVETHRDPDALRLLTVHSPYAVPLCLAAQLDQTRSLSNHARNALAALAMCDLRLNSGVAGLPSTPSTAAQGPIEILTDLGLLNEWVGAAAFVLEYPDMLLIAKAAEAWRRTVAGDWGYARTPVQWSGAEFADGLDALLRVRVHELLAANDPVTASRSLLAAWCGISGALPDKIRKRMQALIARAASAGARGQREQSALEAARLLARAGTPSAFIPALATLVAFKQKL